MKVRRYKDLSKQTFGMLTVLSFSYVKEPNRVAMWLTKCECGKEKIISSNSLRQGRTKSCGCQSILQLNIGRERTKGVKRPYQSGEKCHLWKGGVHPKNLAIRQTLEYKLWRKAVFERDNYTCQICGKIGGELNADHIQPFSTHIELRFSLNNGRTLCVSCHRATDTYGYKAIKNKINIGLLA